MILVDVAETLVMPTTTTSLVIDPDTPDQLRSVETTSSAGKTTSAIGSDLVAYDTLSFSRVYHVAMLRRRV